jgi:catechol 2,3-dioxygenase-like lactoylglutathione lyase family enzyme
MRSLVRPLFLASALLASAAGVAGAQTRGMLPYDHIHVNEPAAEASVWWEKNIPGGRRITESPNRIMYGAVRLMFLGRTSTGPSEGSVIEHLGFSVADLDGKMRELAAINTKVVSPAAQIPGAYRAAMIESPWGTRIQLVQDPELLGLHHVQLRAPDPEAYYAWLVEKLGGQRTKLKGQIDAVTFPGSGGFTTVHIIVARGDSVPSQGRAIDHIGWRSVGPAAETMAMFAGKGVATERNVTEPSNLNLPAGPPIKFFYIVGPHGARIEIVERPGLKPGE